MDTRCCSESRTLGGRASPENLRGEGEGIIIVAIFFSVEWTWIILLHIKERNAVVDYLIYPRCVFCNSVNVFLCFSSCICRRTKHDVPLERIRRMLNSYERYVTVQSIMGSQMPEVKQRLAMENRSPQWVSTMNVCIGDRTFALYHIEFSFGPLCLTQPAKLIIYLFIKRVHVNIVKVK